MIRARDMLFIRDALVFLLLTLLAASVAVAQEPRAMRMQVEPLDIRMPEGADMVRIPFVRELDHVVLSVSVNGSEPMRVVLDTGMPAPGIALYGTPAVEALNLPYGPMRAQIGGAGGAGERLEARIAPGVTLGLGELTLAGAQAIVMPPIAHFASHHDGVIGAALFRGFTVRIDEDAGMVELHRPGTFAPPATAVTVPLSFQHGMPYVDAEVVMAEGGRPVPVKLVVDLGAGHNVSLNPTSSEAIAVPAGAVSSRIGRGISGPLSGQVGRIAELRLGGQSLRQVVATFPDSEHESPRGMDSRNGNLGSGILGRFNLTFDYAGERMLMEPSRRIAEPFRWDMSGMVLEVEDGGALVIADVVSGSPAAAAGLTVGDRLTEVAGQAVMGGDLVALGTRFRRDEGAEIEMQVLRGTQTVPVRIILTSYI